MLGLTFAACAEDGWVETRIPLPGGVTEVTYLRRPMPNWVGAEQYRRVQLGGAEADLPIQVDARAPVDVYLSPGGTTLYFYTGGDGRATLDLRTLSVTELEPDRDSLGTFLGALTSPEIADLEFISAPLAAPTYALR
jgi:hypothetical protein